MRESLESIIHDVIERGYKLYDACDKFLEDPNRPGEYSLDGHASEVRIVWEEVEGWRDGHPLPAEKPVWLKRSGSLQEALSMAFGNGHTRLLRNNPIKFADPRELILKAADRLLATADLLAKLEGRYRPVEKEFGQGNTIQLAVIEKILVQAGYLNPSGSNRSVPSSNL